MWSFFIYSFFVWPVAQRLIKRDRARGVLHACAFLALVAAVSVYVEYFKDKPASYYALLGAPVDASLGEIKKAWRAAGVKYHPDKLGNLSPEAADAAAEHFNSIREAYEVLSDGRLRKVYNSYGVTGVHQALHSASDSDPSSTAMTTMAVFYVMWGMLTYIFNTSVGSARGRSWSFTALIFLALLEWQVRFADFDFLSSALAYMPPFEKIETLHHLYPAFMSAARVVSESTFTNEKLHMQQQLHWLVQTVAQMKQQLDRLESSSGKRSSGSGRRGTAKQAAASGSGENTPNIDPLKRQQLGDQAKQARDVPKGANPKISKPAASPPKGIFARIPSWVWSIGLLVFVRYVLG